MTSLLKARGLWDFCVDENADIKTENVQKIEETKHLLYTSMDPDQINATGSCVTAHDLWVKIKENNEGAEIDMRNNALSDFLSIHFHKSESIVQFCGRFEQLLSRLTATGYVVDDKLKLYAFRNSLPDKYKDQIYTFTTANKDGKFQSLLTHLKVKFHQDQSDKSEDGVALYGNYRQNIRNSNNPRKADNNDAKQKVFCTFCKFEGHTYKTCNKLKQKKAHPQNNDKRNDKRNYNNHNVAFVATKNKCNLDNMAWVIDSGASSHMTPKLNLLRDYQKFEKPKQIYLANGDLTEAIGEGNFYFEAEETSGFLSNVLFAPSMTENLFSVIKAIQLGHQVLFNEQNVVFLKDGKKTLKGLKQNGLFTLNLVPSTNKESAFIGASEEEWHKRFAHASIESIRELRRKDAVLGLEIADKKQTQCLDCAAGKICRSSHHSRSTIRGDADTIVLHIDTCGPISTTSLGGARYFVLAIDEYSSFKYISFISSKSDVSNAVKEIINKAELESRKKVKAIQTDNGSEYINQNLKTFTESRGIVHFRSTPYSPEQNGKVERGNRTIIEGVRTLLNDSKLPESLWAEAANFTVYATNRLMPKGNVKTRHELFLGEKPYVGHMMAFGQTVVTRIPSQHRNSKFSPKAKTCRFVGYTDRINTFRLFNEQDSKLFISCDVIPVSNPATSTQQMADTDAVIFITSKPSLTDGDSLKTSYEVKDNNDQEVINDLEKTIASLNQLDEPEQPQSPRISDFDETSVTEPAKVIKPPVKFTIHCSPHKALVATTSFTLCDEPRSYREALASEDWPRWDKAIQEELNALNKNKTWTLIPRPKEARTIKNKWVFKIKTNSKGDFERFKARLVAKGFSQIENIDYKQTYAPVASLTTVRLLLCIACQNDLDLLQFDIKTAFLNGDLEEEILMEYPEGISNPNNLVCKMQKSIYGLKQAPYMWNKKFDHFLKAFKLQPSSIDSCLYVNDDISIIVAIYVDDGIVASKDKSTLERLVNHLKSAFEVTILDCKSFLGFRIERNRKDKTLFLHQRHYTEKTLKRFGMIDCDPAATPEEVGGSTKIDSCESLSPEFPFKEMVGSLLYLVTGTRPDIAHAVSLASRTSRPTIEHKNKLKRILRYLKGTSDYGICFRWEKNPQLHGYSDADYAMDNVTRRSTTGFCITFGNAPISWKCQRQGIVTLSSTEAEYVAGCDLVKELIPIRSIFIDLKQISNEPTKVFIDNRSTIKIATSPASQQRTKHIDVREKWLTEHVAKKNITIEHIKGSEQKADFLTKALHKTKFINNRNQLLLSLLTLSIINLASSEYLKISSPISYQTTKYQLFTGDKRIFMRLLFINSCESLFKNLTGDPETDGILKNDCDETYILKTLRKPTKCVEVSQENNPNLSGIITNKLGLSRPKRIVELVTSTFLVGSIFGIFNGKSNSETNSKNIDMIADIERRELELANKTSDFLNEIRNTTHTLNDWTLSVNNKLAKIEHKTINKDKIASLINLYQHTFNEYNSLLKDISNELLNNHVPSSLRFLDS